jgi:heat shock protein HtpX
MPTMLKRVSLFIVTNLAVVLLLGVVLRLLGVHGQVGNGGYGGLLIFAAVYGFAGSFISLALSKFMAKWTTGARIIEQPNGPVEIWLVETVRRQSQAAGIGMPDVAIYPSPTPNAFATGMRRNSALVAVSDGLLQSMRRDEVEAVLAHEVSHVANGDMVTLALIQGVVNTFVIFFARIIGSIVDKAVFKSERGNGPGYYLVVIATEIVLGILASTIVMWFSRQREFRADAGAAALMGSPDSMIAALRRLRGDDAASDLPKAIAAFGIRGGGAMKWFASHPPIEDRIAALEQARGRS